MLDSRDLKISGVVDESTGQKLDFSVAEPGFVGSKVEIKLPTSSEKMYVAGLEVPVDPTGFNTIMEVPVGPTGFNTITMY